MNGNYSINGPRLISAFILYSIIGMVLFGFTSGGWFGGLGTMFNLLFYAACFFVLMVKISQLSRREQHIVVLPIGILMSIVAVQLFVYLFNIGDCGDAPGSVLFLQRLLSGTSSWEACRDTHAWFTLPVLFGHLTYYVLVFSLIVTRSGTHERTPTQA